MTNYQLILVAWFLSFSSAEDGRACQGGAAVCFSESQDPSVAGHILALSSTADTPGSWHSFTSRTAEAPGLPTIMCSLSSRELSLTGQQYATSLLNLLHSDRPEMGPSTVSNSKPEPAPSWAVPQGYRESADPPVGFETGNTAAAMQRLYINPKLISLLFRSRNTFSWQNSKSYSEHFCCIKANL